MPRQTSNTISENIDGNVKRTNPWNGPAVETEAARLNYLGAWRQDNVAANQAGVAIAYQSVDANSQTDCVAPRSGKIVSMTWRLSAAITAGVATLQATVNGTGTGDAESIVSASTTKAVVDQTTPVTFAEGDNLGVKITTDGSASPTTSELAVHLVVIYDA